uniref:Uncharacterized protein n=1 Tax=Opuntia streptacantha TaxID=393608 RepID=A0A7C9DZN6_OPUST
MKAPVFGPCHRLSRLPPSPCPPCKWLLPPDCYHLPPKLDLFYLGAFLLNLRYGCLNDVHFVVHGSLSVSYSPLSFSLHRISAVLLHLPHHLRAGIANHCAVSLLSFRRLISLTKAVKPDEFVLMKNGKFLVSSSWDLLDFVFRVF